MATIDAALAWAARGFRVFPLRENGKRPLWEEWPALATTDPDAIRAMWRDPLIGGFQEYNVGVLTHDMIVVDIDVKKGRRGLDNWFEAGFTLDTLCVATPTGGLHLYYSGPNVQGRVNVIGDGIDIRSWHNFVVAPGSKIDGEEYRLYHDIPIRPASELLLSYQRPPGEKNERRDEVSGNLDEPLAVREAIHFLQHSAAPAIAFKGGNDTTYKLAAHLRDLGISEPTSVQLMLQHWNERCQPPWSSPELAHIVENAWLYAENPAGLRNPTATFAGIDIPPLPQAPDELFAFGNALDMQVLEPRKWIIPRILMRNAVTLLLADGSAGKSTLVLTLAAHLAVGAKFFEFDVLRAGKSIIYNAEDDLAEMSRRLHAICTFFGFDFKLVKSRVALLSSDKLEFQLTINSPPRLNEAHVAPLMRAASDPEVAMVAVDPLLEVHSADENDNTQMRYVMSVLRMIARQTETAVLAAHHTNRSRGLEQRAGSAGAARGGTAIVNSSRVALTLVDPTDKDLLKYNLPEEERYRYVRLDDAKANLTMKSNEPVWLQRSGVHLYNGDDVGVLGPSDLSRRAADAALVMAQAIHGEMVAKGTSRYTLAEAVQALQTAMPAYQKIPVNTLRSRVEACLSGGVTLPDGACVAVTRELVKGRNVVSVILS